MAKLSLMSARSVYDQARGGAGDAPVGDAPVGDAPLSADASGIAADASGFAAATPSADASGVQPLGAQLGEVTTTLVTVLPYLRVMTGAFASPV
jgi:hypothetical protein